MCVLQSLMMLRVSCCVFCSMSFLFECMCMRLPFISWSIAGVPSSLALPGYLITAPPSVCVSDVIGALAVWIQKQKTIYIYIYTYTYILIYLGSVLAEIFHHP